MGLIRFIQKHNENASRDEANRLKRQELMIIQQQQEEIRRLRQQQVRANKEGDRFCGKCGHLIDRPDKFCHNCGAKL